MCTYICILILLNQSLINFVHFNFLQLQFISIYAVLPSWQSTIYISMLALFLVLVPFCWPGERRTMTIHSQVTAAGKIFRKCLPKHENTLTKIYAEYSIILAFLAHWTELRYNINLCKELIWYQNIFPFWQTNILLNCIHKDSLN